MERGGIVESSAEEHIHKPQVPIHNFNIEKGPLKDTSRYFSISYTGSLMFAERRIMLKSASRGIIRPTHVNVFGES